MTSILRGFEIDFSGKVTVFRKHLNDFIPCIFSTGNCDGTVEVDIDYFIKEFACETEIEN